MKMFKLFFLAVLLSGFQSAAYGQDFKFNPRYSYYTIENQAEILVVLPEGDPVYPVKLFIRLNNEQVYQADTISRGHLMRIFIPISRTVIGTHLLSARIIFVGQMMEARSSLVKLLPKPNGVRIDRLTGKLIVNDLPWFPFGFYCYSPVQPTLAEEEAVKGFNVMSPYQQIDPATIRDREIYMDRCARLGMKVHCQLISIAGGGGVGSSR
ncbi:MAG: hypothetical protein NTV01_13820, partial [Bacteroidia bacterium]|nr:hypothetical protein [Bacteroidia bacterium]